ncbi:hypothetical protein AAC387_Pa09g0281 [Persea americana]
MSVVQERGGTDVGHHIMVIMMMKIRAVDHVGNLALMRAFTDAEASVAFVEPSAIGPTKTGVQLSSGLWGPLLCAWIQIWAMSEVQESGGTDVGHHMIIIIRAVDHVGDLTLMRAFTDAEATVVFVEPSAMGPTKKEFS